MASADFIVGIIGNVISVLLCIAPIGTFRDMAKKKSAEDYNAIPYIAQLLCKSLWTFYGTLDANGLLIITVNSIGVFSQGVYVLIYLFYAPNDKKVKAVIFVFIVNMIFPGAVVAAGLLIFHGEVRYTFIGYLCAAVTIAMYAAPFSVMRTVIKTKSVRYMPFYLSLFLFLNAAAWFTYAVIRRDYYVIVPNALGILSSSAQIIIYMIYKNKSSAVESMDAVVEEGGSVKKIEEGIKMEELSSKIKDGSGNLTRRSLSIDFSGSLQSVIRTVALGDENHSGLMLVP